MIASNEKGLCFYKLAHCAAGIEVSYCVTIKQDFSWKLCYRGKAVDSSKCSALRQVLNIVDSGEYTK